MAGWLPVFKAVPWIDLIGAAPSIARGARELWAGMRQPASAPAERVKLTPDRRVALLETEVDTLKKELARATEVVRALAEQNEQLVAAVALLRARVRTLVTGCVLLAVVVAAIALAVL